MASSSSSSSQRAKKRPRTESTNKGKEKDDVVNDFDETLFHYYQSRAEHTVKLADDQIQQAQEFDEEEEKDSNRICWTNLQGDDKRCIILTGFSSQEFTELLVKKWRDTP